MITLSGKLYNVMTSDYTDRNTGEVSKVNTAEILHTVRGKTEIAAVKLDDSVVTGWTQCTGKEITCEVRFYAIKTSDGGINSGLILADKKSLPTWITPSLEPVKKAA